MIGVINYGSGNILAIRNIYKRLNIPTIEVVQPNELSKCTKLILPGVGAFDEAMLKLTNSGLRDGLDDCVLNHAMPVLGICVGMQIMGGKSEEGSLPGLNWIQGDVRKFDETLIKTLPKLPHMGWNSIQFDKNSIFEGVDPELGFYFLHSFYFKADNNTDVIARAEYNHSFHCAVNKNNIYGVQFHPEKSHQNGIQVFENFSVSA